MRKREKNFRPRRMVNWFSPTMLLQTGIKTLISEIFGNYADRREMQAALAKNAPNWQELRQQYAERDELWIDFISDTGDGFDATYSVATLAAQPMLTVSHEKRQLMLPRADILVMGGDQIYPTPSKELYDAKFRIPFAMALPEHSIAEEQRPHLYAIPGNHDWYDGLGNFIKIFCQQRSIGAWKTQQDRSYFALPLPGRYWLWATDIQLNADIDQPQLEYFMAVAEQMEDGAKVLLVTAEPAWVYRALYKKDQSWNRLIFFIQQHILIERPGKHFTLAAVLTGDLHHYSHYASEDGTICPHFIDAGGGGAFLHLTHRLPETVRLTVSPDATVDEPLPRPSITATLRARFPSRNMSWLLLLRNFLFPVYHAGFCMTVGLLFFLLSWFARTSATGRSAYLQLIQSDTTEEWWSNIFDLLLHSPAVVILTLLIIASFYVFADRVRGLRISPLLGAVHGCVQALSGFAALWVAHQLDVTQAAWPLVFKEFIRMMQIVLTGGLFSGVVMGAYLYLSNACFGLHLDESSSSFACTDFKNFLRMRVTKSGVTIYAIGIPRATRRWKRTVSNGRLHYEGELPKCELIEDPIETV
jgi:hypothetical protein